MAATSPAAPGGRLGDVPPRVNSKAVRGGALGRGALLAGMAILAVAGPAAPAAARQKPAAPRTLENLLDGEQKVVPEGTLTRALLSSASPAIDEAWQAYDAAVQAASTKLLKAIDARKRRSQGRRDEDAVAVMEAAAKGLTERGVLPSAVDGSLRAERAAAVLAYREAGEKLATRYRTVIAELREDDKPDDASVIADEWSLLANQLEFAEQPQVDSVWRHSITNGPTAEITLYTNGTINAPDGPDTWTLKGSTLTIRWKNPEAPGGEWIDTCELADQGGSYAGKNQLGTRITGKRVP